MKPIKALRSAAFALLAALSSASAADFSLSFTGTFSDDEDIQLFNFTLGSTSDVTIRTLGYHGGTNAQGAIISAGGFDPVLSLFDSSQTLIGFGDDINFPIVLDALITIPSLTAGTYTVALSQFARIPTVGIGGTISGNLADSFSPSGTEGFVDFLGFQRTGAYALDIIVDERDGGQPPVGTPDSGSTLMLLSLAFGGLIAVRRRLRA